MWVECFSKEEKEKVKKWNISLQIKKKIQLRLIIWQTKEISITDVDGTSDIYIVSSIESCQKQMTDTHFQCSNGEACFNWRIIENVDYNPSADSNKSLILRLDIYDKDGFSSSSEYGEIDLKYLFDLVYNYDIPVKLTQKSFQTLFSKVEFENNEQFWIKTSKNGGILCSIEILPLWKANSVIVGKGRSSPNNNPFLPPPEGRLSWSMNPFKILGELVGKRIKRKVLVWMCSIFCCLFCIFFLPNLIQYVISECLNPFNYK